jgi:hypothetical protein
MVQVKYCIGCPRSTRLDIQEQLCTKVDLAQKLTERQLAERESEVPLVEDHRQSGQFAFVPQRQPPAGVPEVTLDRIYAFFERVFEVAQVVSGAMSDGVEAAGGRSRRALGAQWRKRISRLRGR